jgi:hypothetical protein
VPRNVLVLGMWDTRREQPLRRSLRYTCLGVCFTGPLGWVSSTCKFGLEPSNGAFAKMWSKEGIARYVRDVHIPALKTEPITDGFEKLSYFWWVSG